MHHGLAPLPDRNLTDRLGDDDHYAVWSEYRGLELYELIHRIQKLECLLPDSLQKVLDKRQFNERITTEDFLGDYDSLRRKHRQNYSRFDGLTRPKVTITPIQDDADACIHDTNVVFPPLDESLVSPLAEGENDPRWTTNRERRSPVADVDSAATAFLNYNEPAGGTKWDAEPAREHESFVDADGTEYIAAYYKRGYSEDGWLVNIPVFEPVPTTQATEVVHGQYDYRIRILVDVTHAVLYIHSKLFSEDGWTLEKAQPYKSINEAKRSAKATAAQYVAAVENIHVTYSEVRYTPRVVVQLDANKRHLRVLQDREGGRYLGSHKYDTQAEAEAAIKRLEQHFKAKGIKVRVWRRRYNNTSQTAQLAA